MKHQLSGGGRRINLLGDALKGNVLFLQSGDGLNEMLEGAAEAIQTPDHEGITLTKMGERLR